MEINTINSGDNSPEMGLLLGREEKNGSMILQKHSNWNEKGARGGVARERKWLVMAQQPATAAPLQMAGEKCASWHSDFNLLLFIGLFPARLLLFPGSLSPQRNVAQVTLPWTTWA